MSKEGGDLQHRIFQKVHNFDYWMPALKFYPEQYFVLDNEVCQSFLGEKRYSYTTVKGKSVKLHYIAEFLS